MKSSTYYFHMKTKILADFQFCIRVHAHIESSHSLRQNDAKLQTYQHSTLNVKMPDPPKIDVYNFRYNLRRKFN